MIKTLFFDLGNVIVPFDFKLAYARMAQHCGCKFDEVPDKIRATGLVAPFERGEIEARQFVRELSAALQLNIGYDDFCGWWSCVFLPEPLLPAELLEHLASRYRLLLLSNTNSIHFEMLQSAYPLLGHFHDRVLSYQVRAAKPDPRIYQAAIARAQCKPEECFFTDDLAVNVEAARQQGMDAVQFLSADQLRRELEIRGVL